MTSPNDFTPPPSGPGADYSSAGYGAAPVASYDAAPAAGYAATPGYAAPEAGYSAYPVATTPYPGAYQNGPSGKTRSPIGVFLLSIITMGIYGMVWYYKINTELRNYNSSIQVNPGMAVLALFVPIVGFISIYNTGKRIQQAQTASGNQPTCSPVVGLLLGWIIYGHTFYYQDSLNSVWQYRQA